MDNRPQVFINFRGKDLRLTFVPYLKHHLKQSNVNVFTDADALGEPLKNLLNHIRNSKIVIVIFSISYLESKWCLNELVEIRKCLKSKKLDFVIPIFYKVRASHVKDQTGDFGNKFLDLQKKHPHLRIMRWKRALRFVAKQIGLAYANESSISELDFIKNIVEVVTIILNRIALKEKNNETNNTPEASTTVQGQASNLIVVDVNHLNKLLHLSKTSEALNLERSFVRGFMFGFACQDLISSMQIGNSFEITPPANSLQSPMNLQSLDVQVNESVEKAINLLAFHMMSEQTHPALIFSNWDKLDHDTKNNILYSAAKKSQILKVYDEGVDLKPFLSRNITPFSELPAWDKTLQPKVPQDWPQRGHKRAISYHDIRDHAYLLPCKLMS
ncbi:unnamed protein product [Thlaspi arvense]|uniref:TIR domain-containing protein n=1 Tax=Thlaspi arvense TaxID=13288 RepID=A0AAU9T4L3_THLAR|nr:unnamed protein product [Thlaspi arvense]